MTDLESNPFAILTFIVAPAILTNASSINALATSNRLARSIDRARKISSEIEGHENDHDPGITLRGSLLRHAEKRILFLVSNDCFLLVDWFIRHGQPCIAFRRSVRSGPSGTDATAYACHFSLCIRRWRNWADLWIGVIGFGNSFRTPKLERRDKVYAERVNDYK